MPIFNSKPFGVLNALESVLIRYSEILTQNGTLSLRVDSLVATLSNLLNDAHVMLTLHRVREGEFFAFVNEKARRFYGFEVNDVSAMNISFYLKTLHPRSYHLLVQSYLFVHRNDPGFLRLQYRLKNAQELYLSVKGVSKIIAWDDEGMPEYVLSATCESEELVMLAASEIFDMSDFSVRMSECLNLLLKGLTNSQMASELGVAVKTVDRHVERIFDAIGVSNRFEVIRRCHSMC